MPDRDIVHPSLPRIFSKAYKQICEGHDPPDELARVLAKAIRQNLQEYGNKHLCYLDDICRLLDEIISEPLFLPYKNWNKHNFEIENYIRRMEGHPRGIALLREAVKDYIHAIRNGQYRVRSRYEILNRYIERICNANFVDIVPLNQKHYNDITQQTFNIRIEGLRPFLSPYLAAFTSKIEKTGRTNSLPVPKHKGKGGPFDIHADVFKL